ncbi:hypothetical protein DHB64_17990 [Antarcticibacterium sp. W02-3]|nr:hypothetical protein [Antarcticibacterium sp. W02-3]
MEVVLEVLIIILFRYPGAGLRWAVSRLWKSDKTFKDFLIDDAYINGTIGLLFLAAIVIVVLTLSGTV